MKVLIIEGCSGPIGSFVAGTAPIVADEIGEDLIKAGYAELVDANAQPVTASEQPEQPEQPANTGKGAGKKASGKKA